MRYYSITSATRAEVELAHRAFLATCAHIDHQIRRVLGTLADEGQADNTIIVCLSDHGDMLGQHRLWGKAVFYDMAARIPLIIAPPAKDHRLGPPGSTDDRLVDLSDLMPTLLALAGLPIPASVEGINLTERASRSSLYGECGYDVFDTRMLRDEQYKLIYYPVGNRVQLFDITHDPHELHDLAADAAMQGVLGELQRRLIQHFSEEDRARYVRAGKLVGLPAPPFEPMIDRTLGSQRGSRPI
jgi:arylsulfatase A-like enzyme